MKHQHKVPLQDICDVMIKRRRELGVCEVCGQTPPTQQFKVGYFIIHTCEPCMEQFQAILLEPTPSTCSESLVRFCTTPIIK